MCGRYSLATGGREIADAFELKQVPPMVPRYNVAPGQEVPVVREEEGERECIDLHWGFTPPSQLGRTIINARSESVLEKPAFREAFAQRRCLVPATGFYEWRRQVGGRAPHHIHMRDRQLFAMAGLWSWWPIADGKASDALVILTTQPNELIAGVHDRMPVILEPDAWHRWLDPAPISKRDLERLAAPPEADRMQMYPVSSRVNSARLDDPRCIERVEEPPRQMGLF